MRTKVETVCSSWRGRRARCSSRSTVGGGGRARELVKRTSFRLFERKRGVTARERCAVERECLTLWRRHGFDVPALLEGPRLPDVDPAAASWLEYCPGRLLSALLGDAAVPMEERCSLLERLAKEVGQRQALALESSELRLVPANASVKHVLVHGERLTCFDLESVYAPPTPILDALARELTGLLRSVRRSTAAESFEPLGLAFLRGYAPREQLRRVATQGLRGGGLHRRVRRWADRSRRRDSGAKVDELRWLLARLD